MAEVKFVETRIVIATYDIPDGETPSAFVERMNNNPSDYNRTPPVRQKLRRKERLDVLAQVEAADPPQEAADEPADTDVEVEVVEV